MLQIAVQGNKSSKWGKMWVCFLFSNICCWCLSPFSIFFLASKIFLNAALSPPLICCWCSGCDNVSNFLVSFVVYMLGVGSKLHSTLEDQVSASRPGNGTPEAEVNVNEFLKGSGGGSGHNSNIQGRKCDVCWNQLRAMYFGPLCHTVMDYDLYVCDGLWTMFVMEAFYVMDDDKCELYVWMDYISVICEL